MIKAGSCIVRYFFNKFLMQSLTEKPDYSWVTFLHGSVCEEEFICWSQISSWIQIVYKSFHLPLNFDQFGDVSVVFWNTIWSTCTWRSKTDKKINMDFFFCLFIAIFIWNKFKTHSNIHNWYILVCIEVIVTASWNILYCRFFSDFM